MNNEQADDQANDHFLDEDASVFSERERPHQLSSWWRLVWDTLITPGSNPRFPSYPLERPLVGYVAAILLQVIAGIGMILLARASPALRFPGGLILLAVPVTALIWGTGPSILTAFSGTAVFIYLRLNHYFSHSFMRPEDITSIFLYLIIGLTISLLASQTQNTRYRAALETRRLRRYYEELVTQLLAERTIHQASEHKLQMRERELEVIFEVTTDALFILYPLGAPPQVNAAAKKLLDLSPNARINATLDLFDHEGKPLSPEALPETRLLKGERLYDEDVSNVFVRTHTGQFRPVMITGMPVRDADNTIVGAVLICRAGIGHYT